jgi:hypothetical protein
MEQAAVCKFCKALRKAAAQSVRQVDVRHPAGAGTETTVGVMFAPEGQQAVVQGYNWPVGRLLVNSKPCTSACCTPCIHLTCDYYVATLRKRHVHLPHNRKLHCLAH